MLSKKRTSNIYFTLDEKGWQKNFKKAFILYVCRTYVTIKAFDVLTHQKNSIKTKFIKRFIVNNNVIKKGSEILIHFVII